MNKYFLSKDVLSAICSFHCIRHQPISYHYQEGIEEINKNLIRDLIVKQPNLNSEYQSFLELLKSPQNFPTETFSSVFKDKIEINNFINQIFNKAAFFNKGPERLNVLNYILEQYPYFFNLTHNFLKENNDQIQVNYDATLYQFYFKGVKSKKINKTMIDRHEILDNIQSFDTRNYESLYKAKLNAFMSIEPKDNELFQYITESMGDSIIKNAVVKRFWEEKLVKFPKEIQDNYNNSKVSINPFTDSVNYHYIFQINRQYVIEQSQVAETKADAFNRVFHNALSNLISSNFKSKKRLMENNPSVEFLFSDIDERDKVQQFCNLIIKDISSIIKGANFNGHYSEQETYIDNCLNKIYLAYSLNNELNTDRESIKNKNKI
jgi:hypothetical protein